MSITIKELEQWLLNKNINPKTGKKITKNGKIYKSYESLNIKLLYAENCVNDIDPISLNYLWKMDNDKKVIVHNDLDNVVFYKDRKNNIKFFEKTSLVYLKGYNIKNDPITQEELPESLFENIKGQKVINDQEKTLENLALEVFQLFSNISIFIDYNLFLNLNKTDLIKLNYETADFYKNNFTEQQINEISNQVFIKETSELNDLHIDEIKKYILNQYKILLECKNESYKFMINYILVGGLSLVINTVKDDYPQYSFEF